MLSALNRRVARLRRKQQLMLGCGMLVVIFCLCSVLAALVSPSGSRAQPTQISNPAQPTSPPATVQMLPPTATLQPVNTPMPTEPPATAVPAATRTPIPSATPRVVSSPTPAPPRTTNPNGVPPLNKDNCPPDYPIKGNIGSNGKIYHVPASRSYNATDPEICFATTQDAVAAGFRSP